MTEPELTHLTVGEGEAARTIVVLCRPGSPPGLFWLGGFRSDMTGAKAGAIDSLGAERGIAVTRFDYSGHGRSGGRFEDGTISRWLEEAQAVFALTTGPQVVIGSSMGGWLALLLVRALRRAGEARIKALVLIAPAIDMTHALMRDGFKKKELKQLESEGMLLRPSEYGEPYPITRALIEDGEHHLLLGKPIETGCPVTVLQGGKDRDVPKEHALKFVAHLVTDPVAFTLVPDGDHRLSRNADLALLRRIVERAIEED